MIVDVIEARVEIIGVEFNVTLKLILVLREVLIIEIMATADIEEVIFVIVIVEVDVIVIVLVIVRTAVVVRVPVDLIVKVAVKL